MSPTPATSTDPFSTMPTDLSTAITDPSSPASADSSEAIAGPFPKDEEPTSDSLGENPLEFVVEEDVLQSEEDDEGLADADDLKYEEKAEDYCKGGFHPVAIGDKLDDDRFVVERKLGHGFYATVWLARNSEGGPHAAIKVVRSCADYAREAVREVRMYRHANGAATDHPGFENIIRMRHAFEHTGPNGVHTCMAFEVLGEDLSEFLNREYPYGIPIHLAKQVAKQTLLGLDFLHRDCVMIHGDLRMENILVVIGDVQQLLDGTKAGPGEDGEDRPVMASRPLVAPAVSVQGSAPRDMIRVKIADLGRACQIGECQIASPVRYRSPEMVVQAGWSCKTDVWAMGVMVYEMMTNLFLFNPRHCERFGVDDDHIAQMFAVVGPFSLDPGGDISKEMCDSEGRLRRGRRLPPTPLRTLLAQYGNFDSEDTEQASAFALLMLEPDPQKRPAALELANHGWLDNTLGMEGKVTIPGR